MRTIKQLIQKDTKVYIYLRNETVRQHLAKMPTITKEVPSMVAKKVTERTVDGVMALLPGGTICFLCFAGRMCYGGSGSTDAMRIDYEKYANNEENYMINSQ